MADSKAQSDADEGPQDSVSTDCPSDRDELLAMLSHEIRNPLAAIQAATALLARDNLASPVRQDATRIVERQFCHLQHIMENLLDISRLSRNQLQLHCEAVSLHRVIRNAIHAMLHLREDREELAVVLPRDRVYVWGDSIRLEQAVANLLCNAWKFTSAPKRIRVTLSICSDRAQLVVADNGPGIPSELLPRIFEPFIQGKQSIAREHGGLGLGLTLTARIIRLHEGSIGVVANDGEPGVSFVITLPLLRREPTGRGGSDASSRRSLRILLIEDSEDARRMLAQTLRMDGYTVLEAATGFEGLDMLLEEQPEIALVDIGLPEIDGYELARRARREERGATIRLIAVTGYGMMADVVAAEEAGFDAHLVKPVRYPELIKVLDSFSLARSVG